MLVDDMPIASFRSTPTAAGAGGLPLTRASPAAALAALDDTMEADSTLQLFHVRLAISAERHADAGVLLRRMYAWRGYALDAGACEEDDKITLYAETNGKLVGTMSLCLDRQGVLPADAHFGDRLDILRRQGRRLCEPSRLAIDKGMSKRVFASLIHISYLYAHKLYGFTDYVIEVNPRHVAFYRHMLGFDEFGGERQCSRVGAPAVLLRLPLDYMGARIAQWGGMHGAAGQGGERSFYPYFFALGEEPGISARLAALCGAGGRA